LLSADKFPNGFFFPGKISAEQVFPIESALHLPRYDKRHKSLLARIHCRPRQKEERTGQLSPEDRVETDFEGAILPGKA
jgi:hypothetical protein